jgi:hypothetical protein
MSNATTAKNKNKNKQHNQPELPTAPVEQSNATVVIDPVEQPTATVVENPKTLETVSTTTNIITEKEPEKNMENTTNTVTAPTVTATVPVASKEAPRGTKAELIRQVLARTPDAPLKDIASEVMKLAKEQGFTELVCTPQDVSTAKFKKTPATEKKDDSENVTLEDGLKVLKIVGEMGGMKKVAEMLVGVRPLLDRFPNLGKLQKVLAHLAELQGENEVAKLLAPAPVVTAG